MRASCSALVALLAVILSAPAAETVLDAKLHHLRTGTQREWADFPAQADGPALTVRFRSTANAREHALRLRQQDVKQPWRVLLNGKELGRLIQDENDTIFYLTVPPNRLIDGENTVRIESNAKAADDIRVGEITLTDRPLADVLGEATVEVTILEDRPSAKPAPVPARLTVLAESGALMTTGAKSGGRLAVRPGVVYTADGTARFTLPAGTYTLIAGRGFEYGIDSVRVTLKPGDTVQKTLTIRREVPTPGYASCDTHVHTLTHSGHGDATVEERMVTIAGEGLELPVATDHNKQIDYESVAKATGLRGHFTPIIGNEVTTSVGHFNVFPVRPGGPLPDHRVKDWESAFVEIARSKPRIIVLNHPRDRHAGFTPFGPERFLAATGEDLPGWELKANAMEVVNSGAQQSDMLRLYRDWFALLNRGLSITPVGSSDSHDVSRYIVGQGRTYVRCREDDPFLINIEEVLASLRDGRVLVSCGLLTDIKVNDKYGPGDLVPAGELKVAIRVLGPSWTTADRVTLYANGIKVKDEEIKDGRKPGVKWAGEWTLPKPKHDVHLVAIATGPGDIGLHWPIGKPYQPTSPVLRKRVIGSTGAVWVDADGAGKRSSAFEYARRVMKDANGKWPDVVRALAGYDESVAAQAAGLLRAAGTSVADPDVRAAAKEAGPAVERGFAAFSESWRESQIARTR
jgi:hypothetical protein